MTDHRLRLWLQDLFRSVPGAKKEFERAKGIDPDKAPSWLLRGGIDTLIENETLHRQQDREDGIRKEGYQREDEKRIEDYQRAVEIEERREVFMESLAEKVMYAQAELKKREFEAYAKIEEMKGDRLQEMLTQLSQYLVGGVRESLEGLPKQMVETGIQFLETAQAKNLLPAPPKPDDIVEIGHATHCIGSANGPDNVVYQYAKADGHMYRRCIIAHAAHKRSVLGLHFINSDLLKQGGCPLYYSKNLGEQILGGLLPAFTSENCNLADGYEWRIGG